MQRLRPAIRVESLQLWRGGVLLGESDQMVLTAAHEASLTLVTYDVSTIAPLLAEFAANGRSHAGVVFIDHRSVSQGDLGGQAAALVEHWDDTHDWDWTNRVIFFRPERSVDRTQ